MPALRSRRPPIPGIIAAALFLLLAALSPPAVSETDPDFIRADKCIETGCYVSTAALGCNFLNTNKADFVLGPDTDGDGVRDDEDEDDDCDQLSDELESHFGLDPKSRFSFTRDVDDRFNIFLGSNEEELKISVRFTTIEHGSKHPDKLDHPEPFLLAGLSGEPPSAAVTGVSLIMDANGQPEYPLPKVPGLNCHSHPTNTATSTIDATVTAQDKSGADALWPRDFRDQRFANRDSTADFPNLGLHLPLWDDDDTKDDQCDSGSETYAEASEFWATYRIMNLAHSDVGSPPTLDQTIGSATLYLEIQTALNSCAIWWANYVFVAPGESAPELVRLSDMPLNGEGSCT